MGRLTPGFGEGGGTVPDGNGFVAVTAQRCLERGAARFKAINDEYAFHDMTSDFQPTGTTGRACGSKISRLKSYSMQPRDCRGSSA